MSGVRTEKPLQCRNLAIDLFMSYNGCVRTQADSPGRTGKDFFISQPCHVKLQIAVFWMNSDSIIGVQSG